MVTEEGYGSKKEVMVTEGYRSKSEGETRNTIRLIRTIGNRFVETAKR